jgi:hypothetical protein
MFQGVAQEMAKNHLEEWRSSPNQRQMGGADPNIPGLEFVVHLIHGMTKGRGHVDWLESSIQLPADTNIGEKIIDDQLQTPAAGLDNIGDLYGFLREFSTMVFFQEVAIGDNAPKRLLHVMGGDPGEALEIVTPFPIAAWPMDRVQEGQQAVGWPNPI